MSRRAYSEINLHLVWHVKGNLSILTAEIEAQAHRYIRGRALEESRVIFHAIGGTDDHVHLAVSVPPTLLISEWVGKLKGGSTFHMNRGLAAGKHLAWQEGYGVVSFSSKGLPWVVAYVLGQREHHARQTTLNQLECSEIDDEEEP